MALSGKYGKKFRLQSVILLGQLKLFLGYFLCAKYTLRFQPEQTNQFKLYISGYLWLEMSIIIDWKPYINGYRDKIDTNKSDKSSWELFITKQNIPWQTGKYQDILKPIKIKPGAGSITRI